VTDVACGKYAGHARLERERLMGCAALDLRLLEEIATGENVASGVACDFSWGPLGPRLAPDDDEQSVRGQILGASIRALGEVEVFERVTAAIGGRLAPSCSRH
jgi:hypothetical protein